MLDRRHAPEAEARYYTMTHSVMVAPHRHRQDVGVLGPGTDEAHRLGPVVRQYKVGAAQPHVVEQPRREPGHVGIGAHMLVAAAGEPRNPRAVSRALER